MSKDDSKRQRATERRNKALRVAFEAAASSVYVDLTKPGERRKYRDSVRHFAHS